MSRRARLHLLYLPASLAILLAGNIGQAPAASASGVSPDSMPAAASGFGSALVGSAPVGKGPVRARARPGHAHHLRRERQQRQRPERRAGTRSRLSTRGTATPRTSHAAKGRGRRSRSGNLPSTIAIDQHTDTVYVTDTATTPSRCSMAPPATRWTPPAAGRHPPTVPVGLAPLGIFADPANHTSTSPTAAINGAGSGSTTVSMLDSATCNAADLAACPAQPPPTVDVGADPNDVDVNQATHTVYVTTHRGAQNGWAVFNASTCNATVQSGCGTIGRLTGDPAGPNAGRGRPGERHLVHRQLRQHHLGVRPAPLRRQRPGRLRHRHARHRDAVPAGRLRARPVGRGRCPAAQRLRRRTRRTTR